MKPSKRTLVVNNMFYRDENSNLILHLFWNSLFVAFFLLPLDINFPTPFFMVSIILGCINIVKAKQRFVSDNKALLLFPLYFVIMAVSLTYTDNLSDGIQLLQRSLTLLLFPVIFLFVKEDALTVRKLFDFLLLGLIVSFFINLFLAIQDAWSIVKGQGSFEGFAREPGLLFGSFRVGWDHFLNTQFSRLISPSYVSLYILLVLSYYLKKKLETKLQALIVVLLFLYIFLLASKAAYLILLVMSLMLIFKISDKSMKYTMFIVFLLGTVVFLNNPQISNVYGSGTEYNATISGNSRILSWKAGIQAINEAPIFGYGIGDANDFLIEKYRELNYLDNFERRYNAHNQFLQTWLQTGVLGVGVLMFIFTLLAVSMRRSLNEFSVFLILLISLLFESMLVRFNGIVFFSIIVPLLLKKRSILSSRIIRNDAVLGNRP